MDSTEPPQIQLERLEACRDAAVARAELGAALASSLAPTRAWRVSASFRRSGERVTAEADVSDPDGVSVAQRSMSARGVECASVAKAIGVWASLVLDAEVERVKRAVLEELPSSVEAPPAARSAPLWPEAAVPDKPSPEQDLFLHHAPEHRTIELGLQSFVMGGTGGGAVLGPSIYGIFETMPGLFLRPTLMLGHSVGFTTTSVAEATFLAARIDACARLPGLYLEHRGLQFDLCGGVESGASELDSGVAAVGARTTLPFVALGPSFGFRGELGNNLSATVRGVAEISLIRDDVLLANDAMVAPSLFVARGEVGLSWALR